MPMEPWTVDFLFQFVEGNHAHIESFIGPDDIFTCLGKSLLPFCKKTFNSITKTHLDEDQLFDAIRILEHANWCVAPGAGWQEPLRPIKRLTFSTGFKK